VIGVDNVEDKEIVDLFWARSENAIVETSQKYGNYCMAIARNILSNHNEAEESVNDTYLAAWKTMPPSRPVKLSAFLGRITRNIALNKYDYNKAGKRNGEFDLVLSELGDCISTYDNYEEGQVAKAISAFLRGLDNESRNTFIRRYWYSDSISDVSKRFGMSESKVKSMLFRTRQKLRTYLEKEGVTP
jgi:RNA polymerase sigma-70 factor (ECF subfamily)